MRTYFIPSNCIRDCDTITHYSPNLDSDLWKEIAPLTEEEILALGYRKLRASIGFVQGCYIKETLGCKSPDDISVPQSN
jgi:hypothetical protein